MKKTNATTLGINFYAENITEELRAEFMQAVAHEKSAMTMQLINDSIEKLDKKIATENNENKVYSEEDYAAFKKQREELESAKKEEEEKSANTLEVYTKVENSMSLKNEHGFGNHKDVVRTVLRVLATWDNSKLVKYAIVPCFESPVLYETLETIHVLSKADEDGRISMTKDVKEAYKNATKELESIIKNTFSLPFATLYTDKTRVKMDSEDKKLLNECYVKGFRNKFDEKDGVISFRERQINTLVKAKKNRKTGKIEYNYTALATTICNIVMKHYFA